MKMRFEPMKPAFLAITLLMLVLGGMGCQTAGLQSGELEVTDFEQPFRMLVVLDDTVYRPGEAVMARVILENTSDKTLSLRKLDYSSLEFTFQRLDGEEAMIRHAEHSSREETPAFMNLPAGQSAERTFLITRFTKTTGPFKLFVKYEPNPPYSNDYAPLISNWVRFIVYGDPKFERDAEGILMKDDAIGLARAALGMATRSEDAILIEDEIGFYLWWVNLEPQQPVAGQRKVAYFVDPYRGFVRHQARPFPASMKTEGHLIIKKDPLTKSQTVPGNQSGLPQNTNVPSLGAETP